MKLYRYIPLATIAVAMAACSDELSTAYQSDPNAVKVTATIAGAAQSRVNTEDWGDIWSDGDHFYVENVSANAISGKSTAVYNYDGSLWALSGTDYMVWVDGENTFQAYYPYGAKMDDGSGEEVDMQVSYTSFVVPSNQASLKYFRASDWMTASLNTAETSNKAIELTFEHQLAKVEFKLTNGAQYSSFGYYPPVMTSYVYIPKTLTDSRVSLYDAQTGVTPYLMWDDNYTITTAIVPPGKYSAGDNLLMVWLDVDGLDERLYVEVPSSGDINTLLCETGLEKGKSYTFNVTVGKDVMTIKSVTVEDWAEGTLTEATGTADDMDND